MVELDQYFTMYFILIGGVILGLILIVARVKSSTYYIYIGLILVVAGLLLSFIFGNNIKDVFLFKADPLGFARPYKIGCAVTLGGFISTIWNIVNKGLRKN